MLLCAWTRPTSGMGGGSQADLENLTKAHLKRIKHVHLKNVRKDVLPVAVSNKYSFYQAIQKGIFTVPGDPKGDLKLDRILEALRSSGYNGWLVVEAEQNPLHENPRKCAKTARAYIKSRLGY